MNGPETCLNFSSTSEHATVDRFPWTQGLSWTQSAAVCVHCYWAREAVRGLLAGDFGPLVGAGRALVRVSVDGPIQAELQSGARRRLFRLVAPEPARLEIRVAAAWDPGDQGRPPRLGPQLLGLAELGDLAAELLAGRIPLDALPRAVRLRLHELFPDWDGGGLPEAPAARLECLAALSDRVWSEVTAALERQCSAALASVARSAEAAVLFEAALEPGPDALAFEERLRRKDFRLQAELGGVAGDFLLSRALPGEWKLELHLPLLNRNEWKKLVDGLSTMQVRAAELGRVLVAPAEPSAIAIERWNFQQGALLLGSLLPRTVSTDPSRPTLAFSEQRRLSAAQARHLLPRILRHYGLPDAFPDLSGDIEVNLTLGLRADPQPWLEAPRARSPEYYAAFGEVSRTLQQALRIWLPYFYFADLERFEDVETAIPMLVYQASRPASGKAAADFTYDVMNLDSVHRALRTASAALPEILRSVVPLLEESGREAAAARYARLDFRAVLQFVKDRPRWFQSLLAADAAIIGELIKLAMVTRVLRDEPAEAPRRLYRALEQFTAAQHQRLRRLYGRFSAVPLGSLVLLEASRALAVALGRPDRLQTVLRWRAAGGETAETVDVSRAPESVRRL